MLENNKIYLEDDYLMSWKSPLHVLSLRSNLLDTDCTIPDTLGCSRDDELDLPRRGDYSEFGDIPLSADVRSEITQELNQYKKLSDEAKQLKRGRDREAEWVDFFGDYFFKPLVEATVVSDRHTRQ